MLHRMMIGALACLPVMVQAAEDTDARIAALEKELNALKQEVQQEDKTVDKKIESAKPNITVGGAVRFQYSFEDYSESNRDRGGDIDMDVFRLNLDGSIGDVILSAEYRWYQYMDVIHHAYVGYQFNDNWLGKIGITQVPFGNLKYNSNSFFFSTNFYLGLEDDYDAGIVFTGDYGKHNIDLGFFKNDELGGIDGWMGSNSRTDRYSYDIVGKFEKDQDGNNVLFALAESNTFNLRYTYDFDNVQLGASAMYGELENSTGDAGDRTAYALHLKANMGKNWGALLQFTDYEYNLNQHRDFIAVGAWAFYDTIPTSAQSYTGSLTYSMDVKWGPITNLKFYDDLGFVTNKSGNAEDTIMNVFGVAVSSGGLYTQIDLITAKNQPFIGGSLAGSAEDYNTRININFGYYF
ncbi:carbohydrate porin [Shewanella marina]|uniref:carbohydrate porin n=1 Tax=Shewanella marina TaxID=487319 RepID=UPI0006841E79|nr:carbohydrate porin [Shewanella marina]